MGLFKKRSEKQEPKIAAAPEKEEISIPTNHFCMSNGSDRFEQKWYFSVTPNEGEFPTISLIHEPSEYDRDRNDLKTAVATVDYSKQGIPTYENKALIDSMTVDAQSGFNGYVMGTLTASKVLNQEINAGKTPDKWNLNFSREERGWIDGGVGHAEATIVNETWRVTPQYKNTNLLSQDSADLAFRASAKSIHTGHIVNGQLTDANARPLLTTPTGRTQMPQGIEFTMHGMLAAKTHVFAEMQAQYQAQQAEQTSDKTWTQRREAEIASEDRGKSI